VPDGVIGKGGIGYGYDAYDYHSTMIPAPDIDILVLLLFHVPQLEDSTTNETVRAPKSSFLHR
jgi:hypothetical protein